jgi:hypothetical protein
MLIMMWNCIDLYEEYVIRQTNNKKRKLQDLESDSDQLLKIPQKQFKKLKLNDNPSPSKSPIFDNESDSEEERRRVLIEIKLNKPSNVNPNGSQNAGVG